MGAFRVRFFNGVPCVVINKTTVSKDNYNYFYITHQLKSKLNIAARQIQCCKANTTLQKLLTNNLCPMSKTLQSIRHILFRFKQLFNVLWFLLSLF